MTTATASLSVLKGPHYADAVRGVCADLPPVTPLEGLKYRRILAAGALGGETMFATLGFIAHGLRMRGAEVTFLQCDAALPACVAKIVDHQESACTRWCGVNSAPFADAMNLPCRTYGDFLTAADRADADAVAADVPLAEIADFRWRGVHVGPMVLLSARRFFQRGDVELTDPAAAAKARDYLRSALYLRCIAERALDDLRIEKVYMTDGVYVDWGVLRAVAALKGIPVDFFLDGMRGHSVRFFADPAPARTTPTALWERWRGVPLSPEEQHRLDDYLHARAHKPYDTYAAPWQRTDAARRDLARVLGLPEQRRGLVFGMFTNIGFDACVDETPASYAKPVDWIFETVEFFLRHPDHHLIIKTHPHEAWAKRPSLDRVDRLVDQRFGRLPPNIHLVPPESNIMAHAVIAVMDVGLVYSSTVTIEAAALGKPCLLTGGGPNAGKGITRDVVIGEDYAGLLAALCAGSLELQVDRELARRYAYYVFFRQSLPLSAFDVFDWDVTRINLGRLADLAPGRDAGMDAICNGILCDAPFEWAGVSP